MPKVISTLIVEMEDDCELGVQTIKIYGESVGITSVPEEAAKYLASEVTFLLKEVCKISFTIMRKILEKKSF